MTPEKYAISAEKMREILEVSRLLAVTSDLDHLLMEIAKAAQKRYRHTYARELGY